MSINKEQTDLIDSYFDGHMSASEKVNLESQLSSDPLLKSEFEHQQEIVRGLQDFRRAQLKTRLEGIAVNPGVLGFISQSAAFKSISYVAAGLLVGTGLYLYSLEDEPRVQNIDYVNPYLRYSLDNEGQVQISMPLEYKYESTASSDMKWVEPTTRRALQPEVSAEPVANAATKPSHSFDVPQIAAETGDESGLLGEDMDAVAPVRLDDLSDVGSLHKMEIENIITNKYKFHYKLENGRLYLFGKFDVSPYQILELNNKSGKKLFFQYDGNYFRLKENTREITPLEKIEDQSIISELEIIKSK